MISVALFGIERPDLPAILAARGIGVAADAPVVVAAAGSRAPDATVMVEAADADGAAAALDGGAADAVTRSDPDALVAARVVALARRLGTAPLTPGAVPLTLGDLSIDPVARRVVRAGRELSLLPREYALLLRFAREAGTTVSRTAIRAAVWGREFDPGTNVIEVHVSRLRAKLHRGFASPVLLTDKGRGYRLVPAPIAAGAAAV